MSEDRATWRFPRTFWVANVMEMFERAAYYGCFIFLTVYLTKRVGFTDKETGIITGVFSFLLYFMPTIMGTLADRIGFKSSICAAFGLLATGYAVLGAFPEKLAAFVALALILMGGAIVKPVISGTTAKCSDEHNRARAFSLFYWAVNIGAFSGKSVVEPIRNIFMDPEATGIVGSIRNLLGNPTASGSEYQFVNLYSAAMALIGLALAIIVYRNVEGEKPEPKEIKEIFRGLGKVVTNWRFLCLIIITGLFWSIQGQLYATMPKYLFRTVGEWTKPAWIANINPAVVVLFVVPITHLVRKMRPVGSIGIAFLLIPLSALSVALAPNLGAGNINLGFISLHPIVFMMCIGIIFQGLSECFLSPRFLEFASKQAPPGETGLYMGYSHLNAGFGWLFGFVLSGFLLDKWCPDPETLGNLTETERAARYAHAHYIWWVFVGIGILGFILLMIYRYITDRLDKRALEETGES